MESTVRCGRTAPPRPGYLVAPRPAPFLDPADASGPRLVPAICILPESTRFAGTVSVRSTHPLLPTRLTATRFHVVTATSAPREQSVVNQASRDVAHGRANKSPRMVVHDRRGVCRRDVKTDTGQKVRRRQLGPEVIPRGIDIPFRCIDLSAQRVQPLHKVMNLFKQAIGPAHPPPMVLSR